MKLGVIASHLAMRNDIRNLIDHLNKHFELIVFIRPSEKKYLDENFEFREITYSLNSIWNRICKKIFWYFSKVPKSKENFFFSQKVLALKTNKGWRGVLDIWLIKVLPNLISYDKYLSLLRGSPYKIDDVDAFFSLTPHNEDVLMSQILQNNKKLYTYLHSWDHPGKFSKILRKRGFYFTWNQNLKKDLIDLHGVKDEKARAIGISQFTIISDIKREIENRIENKTTWGKFFYYVASWGNLQFASQEVELVKYLASSIGRIDDKVKLVFRPYPMLNNWSCYNELKVHSNIIFDNYNKVEKDESVFSNSDLIQKFSMVSDSMGVIHCGTTIGLEACFFNKPILYLNLEDLDYGVEKTDSLHITKGWKQYHLEKYFKLTEYDNVVLKKNQLKKILRRCIDEDVLLLNYSNFLREEFPLNSMSDILDEIVNEITKK